MTVGELGRRMTSAEFTEWLAFESEYGLPDEFTSMGMICATTARSMTGSKANPGDFVPFFQTAKRRMTDDSMKDVLMGIVRAQNEAQG